MPRSIDFMRKEIASVYGPYFVSDKGPRQIAAIYNNMRARGKFDKPKNPGEENGYYQMTLFDWLYSKGEKLELWETQ